MSAKVIQLWDYRRQQHFQRPGDLERMREMEKEAAKILGPFVETTGFTEPEKDPA